MYVNNDIDYLKALKNKKVYVFGAGKVGKAVVKKFEKKGIVICGIIDNSKAVQGSKILNYDVIGIETFANYNTGDSIIVIASDLYERDIRLQLMDSLIYNFISYKQIDFGGSVEYYDEDYFEWQKSIGEFGGKIKAEMFKKHIKSTDTLVEFGSGGGFLLKNLQAGKKIGIEINESARKNAEAIGIKSVATADELEDECADIIISSSVLEHVENPLGELRRLYRILKTNGKIVFHVPNESCDTEYSRSEINNHLYTWNCLNIGNLFKAAGFFVYSVERVQEVWPKNFQKIQKEVSPELFEEICILGGRAFDENRCIIVAYK